MPFQHPYLDDAQNAAVEATGRLAEWHRWTAEHSLRVMRYANALGRAMELSEHVLDSIGIASMLHDIGKTAIPVDVLNKPGSLSPGEWSLVRAHPQLGAEIADRLGYDAAVSEMISSHHEHWNGSGYPFGVAGDEIPMGARIICVADVFDALTTPRSYRAAVPLEQALDIMSIESGNILDPYLFETFRLRIGFQLYVDSSYPRGEEPTLEVA